MSPIGEAFRERLRMFPSLVNCCTIDWFRAWPDDALDAVAVRPSCVDVEMEKHNRQSTVEMCKIFHESVRDLSEEFLRRRGGATTSRRRRTSSCSRRSRRCSPSSARTSVLGASAVRHRAGAAGARRTR
jgi:hypothetical protein